MARIDTLHIELTTMRKNEWLPAPIYIKMPARHYFIILEVFYDKDVREYFKQFLNQIEDL